jgi:AAA+ superfamily predicted ATPase
VGKTSTAECVADETKRPLFPVTCGDIGETALEVERNLQVNFGLAHKWGCVLLLDEADVFLAKRNKTDLRRNAVVSVFLRSLEYYAGVLFLTTNRVGGIDPAFKSRIHLSLYYPNFDLDATLNLYEVFIGRIKKAQKQDSSPMFVIKDREIMRFAKRHFKQLKKEGLETWNGR